MEEIFNFLKNNFLIIILILIIFEFKNNNIKENFSSNDTCETSFTCPKDEYVMSDDKKNKKCDDSPMGMCYENYCCDLTCGSHYCFGNMEDKDNKKNIKCPYVDGVRICDNNTCCNEKEIETCESSHSCSNGWVSNDSKKNKKCTDSYNGICDDKYCCEKTCESSHSCTDGWVMKDSKKNQKCPDNNCDDNFCCDKTCESHSCTGQWENRDDKKNKKCPDNNCVDEYCCGERSMDGLAISDDPEIEKKFHHYTPKGAKYCGGEGSDWVMDYQTRRKGLNENGITLAQCKESCDNENTCKGIVHRKGKDDNGHCVRCEGHTHGFKWLPDVSWDGSTSSDAYEKVRYRDMGKKYCGGKFSNWKTDYAARKKGPTTIDQCKEECTKSEDCKGIVHRKDKSCVLCTDKSKFNWDNDNESYGYEKISCIGDNCFGCVQSNITTEQECKDRYNKIKKEAESKGLQVSDKMEWDGTFNSENAPSGCYSRKLWQSDGEKEYFFFNPNKNSNKTCNPTDKTTCICK